MPFKLKLPHLPEIERRRIATPVGVKMRLNRLEYPEPWTNSAVQNMLDNAVQGIQQYPDYPPFIERLAEHTGQPAERIVLGAGIEEFIRALFMLCDGVMVTPHPTCAMHRVYAEAFKVPMRWLETDPRDTGSRAFLRRVLGACDSGVGVLLLANPGQPVQTYLTPAELAVIAARCHTLGIVLAIDEAYHGFGSETAMPLVDGFPNVIVLRTFSKAMGLAGARIGYAVAQRPLIGFLDGVRQSGEVSSLSMHLATYALDNLDRAVGWRIESVIAGRELILEAIPRVLGLEVFATYGNSVLIDCQTSQDALNVTAVLAERGILIRHVPDLGEGEFVMVTCGREAMMEAFAAEFQEGWECRNLCFEKA